VFVRDRIGEEAFMKAEKIRKAVKKESVKTRSKSIKVTMSIGVASTRKGLDDIGKMIKTADDNVYKAKKRGRDRVVAE
jgi:diguanylate cyclase (GGDEF)-like protein